MLPVCQTGSVDFTNRWRNCYFYCLKDFATRPLAFTANGKPFASFFDGNLLVVSLAVPKVVVMTIIFLIYVVGGMARDVPLEDVFKGVAFFLPAYVICVLILMIFPEIITFLPTLMR